MRKQRATKPLAQKLRTIRLYKNLSQGAILTLVYPEADHSQRALVSQWENAKREPSRQVLIRYKQLAGISFEELLIDENKLPADIARFIQEYQGDIRKKLQSNSEL